MTTDHKSTFLFHGVDPIPSITITDRRPTYGFVTLEITQGEHRIDMTDFGHGAPVLRALLETLFAGLPALPESESQAAD